MTTHNTHETRQLNATIEHHLGDIIPDEIACTVPEIAKTLHDVLRHYVDLLESGLHGGWSLDEDNTVRTALRALAHSGWQGRLPRLNRMGTL